MSCKSDFNLKGFILYIGLNRFVLSGYCKQVYDNDRLDDSCVVVDVSLSLAEEVSFCKGDCKKGFSDRNYGW